ncbi:MAG: DUF1778 domain-containing protein [Chloroflexota bacterium]|nr:DUF1778 domain-containing protein [Chloroflexota bacterium]
MPRTAAKDERLHLRVDAVTKRKLLDASAYEHQSVSDFVLSHALPVAERILDAHQTLTLTTREWDGFYDALLNPPAPNEALRAAFRRYGQQQGASG